MKTKLNKLAELKNRDVFSLLKQSVSGPCLGICVNKECNHIKEVEPDKTEYCVICGTKSIVPCLLLAGIT